MKRGQLSTLQAILILLISSAAILFLVGKFFGAAKEPVRDGACLLSSSVADTMGTALRCNTHYHGELPLDPTDPADGAKQISEMMTECWSQFGKGVLDPFPSATANQLIHCFPCDKFSLPKGVKITNAELIDYQKKKAIDSFGTTYFDKLSKGDGVITHNTAEYLIVGGDDLTPYALRDALTDTKEEEKGESFLTFLSTLFLNPDSAPSVIEGGKDYVVLYYALSDRAVSQVWGKMRGEKFVTPKKVFVIRYDEIAKAGCDAYLA